MRFGADNKSASLLIGGALLAALGFSFDCQVFGAAPDATGAHLKSGGEKRAVSVGAASKPDAAKGTKGVDGVQSETSTKAKSQTNAKASHWAKSAPRKMMVPPPPPEIPLISDPEAMERHLSTLGVPLDFMSKSDLENMRTRLLANETKAERQAADSKADYKDKQERVKRFEDLYQEGVVSRKELEAAHRDLNQAENDMRDQDERLQDAMTDLTRVNKQLAAIELRSAKTASVHDKAKSKSAINHL